MDHGAEVVTYYQEFYDEIDRLDSGGGLLERLRPQEIIDRDLAKHADAGLDVADVGGGPGAYAQWLEWSVSRHF